MVTPGGGYLWCWPLMVVTSGADPWWWWPLMVVTPDGGDPDGGDSWWWRPLMVVTPDGGDPWWWWPLVVVTPDGGDPWWWRPLVVVTPTSVFDLLLIGKYLSQGFSHTSDFHPCREQLWDKSISHGFHYLQLCTLYLAWLKCKVCEKMHLVWFSMWDGFLTTSLRIPPSSLRDSGGIRRLVVRKIHLAWKTIQNAYHLPQAHQTGYLLY